MNPITPQRFIELMSKTDKRYLKLWYIEFKIYIEIKYIWKSDPYVWEGKAYEGGSYNLDGLYETKPETLYDELKSCIDNEHYHKLIDKHRVFLESKIIEEPNETNN